MDTITQVTSYGHQEMGCVATLCTVRDPMCAICWADDLADTDWHPHRVDGAWQRRSRHVRIDHGDHSFPQLPLTRLATFAMARTAKLGAASIQRTGDPLLPTGSYPDPGAPSSSRQTLHLPCQTCDEALLWPRQWLATSAFRTPLLNNRASGLSMTDPDTRSSVGAGLLVAAAWIVFSSAFVLALIVGGVVLVVVLGTRTIKLPIAGIQSTQRSAVRGRCTDIRTMWQTGPARSASRSPRGMLPTQLTRLVWSASL